MIVYCCYYYYYYYYYCYYYYHHCYYLLLLLLLLYYYCYYYYYYCYYCYYYYYYYYYYCIVYTEILITTSGIRRESSTAISAISTISEALLLHGSCFVLHETLHHQGSRPGGPGGPGLQMVFSWDGARKEAFRKGKSLWVGGFFCKDIPPNGISLGKLMVDLWIWRSAFFTERPM